MNVTSNDLPWSSSICRRIRGSVAITPPLRRTISSQRAVGYSGLCIDTITHAGLSCRKNRRTRMYSQQELDDAVASGVITAAAANALRAHVEASARRAIPDEEQFRLITGFNDIFVSIAAAILLFAVGWIGQSIGQVDRPRHQRSWRAGPSFLAPLAVAATAWGLALFFTARRRMALPSILLLLAFVGGVLATSAFVARPDHRARPLQQQRSAPRRDRRRRQRGDRRRRRLAPLAPLPCADHRRRRRRCRRRDIPGDRGRHRPAGPMQQAPRT